MVHNCNSEKENTALITQLNNGPGMPWNNDARSWVRSSKERAQFLATLDAIINSVRAWITRHKMVDKKRPLEKIGAL